MRGAKVSNIANHRAHSKRDAAGRRIPAVRDPDIATTLHRAQPHRRSSRPSDGILKSRRLHPGASKEGCLKENYRHPLHFRILFGYAALPQVIN
jgi:hypothetical protein